MSTRRFYECLCVLKQFKILPEFRVKNFKDWLTFEFPQDVEFVEFMNNNPLFNCNSKLGTVLSAGLNEVIFDLPYRLSKRVEKLKTGQVPFDQPSSEVNVKTAFSNIFLTYRQTDKDILKRIRYKERERIETLMEEYLGYRFKEPTLLMHAFTKESDEPTFERLEFLGDAVIESMSLYIARKILLRLGVSSTPELLHSVKVIALSNLGLANILIFHRLHRFICFPKNIEKDIYDYINKKNFSNLCKESSLREVEACPKFLGDSMEALCGAIFLDGGWKALLSVFGRMAMPVIYFVCKYFDETVVDLIHDIIAFYAQRSNLG